MSAARVIPYGPDAALVEFADSADHRALARGRALVDHLGQRPGPGVGWVPAFHRVLLRGRPGDVDGLAESVREVVAFLDGLRDGEVPPGRTVVLPVVYDGPDLGWMAAHSGLLPGEVADLHAAGDYPVHCLGFMPGFPYLGGLDPRLHAPRRTVPRSRVAPGSVGIGGEHTGVYTVASPGGWRLIGRCGVPLFDPTARTPDGMFRVSTGDRVRFEVVRGPVPEGFGVQPDPDAASWPGGDGCGIRVVSPGLGMSLQDGGRPGWERFGVAPGGAMDPVAASWANRLVDNPPSAAVVEMCLQGQELVCLSAGWLAVAGSAEIEGVGRNRSFRVRPGDRLRFLPGPSGIWTCLAVPGGWRGREWLGSLSAHSRAGLGWIGRAGDELRAVGEEGMPVPSAVAGRIVPWDEDRDFRDPPPLRAWPGPQWGDFPASQRETFLATEWEVTSQADRVGYRLAGPALDPEPAQILSEPVIPGSVQIPAGGQPIVTLADGPTLGGYPKIVRIHPDDLPWLVQCRPGQRIRFRLAD